jgi:hypothetical protein
MAHTLITPTHRFLVALALCWLGSIAAAGQITLPDEVRLGATERRTIDVTGSLNVANGDQVSLECAFTPSTFRPVAAAGSQLDAFRCVDVPILSMILSGSRTGTFALTCDSASPIADGTICSLTLGGVAGGDTIGELRVTGMVINGRTTPVNPPAVMRVVLTDAGSAIANATEGIAGNYPNPFPVATRIEYVVSDPGMVAMEIRDLAGRLFHTFDPIYREPGTYSIDYRPKIWEMSSGHYLVRMITERGTYLHTITVEK